MDIGRPNENKYMVQIYTVQNKNRLKAKCLGNFRLMLSQVQVEFYKKATETVTRKFSSHLFA